MPITVIVGGQYGSEGKGKVSYYFANKLNAHAVIRSGGPNAGHSVIRNDQKIVFRQLPVTHGERQSILVAGTYIDLEVLRQELLYGDDLIIDPYAAIIEDFHKKSEKDLGITIGSTMSGTGAALIERLKRNRALKFAYEIKELSPYVKDTIPIMRSYIQQNKELLIEGSQGFGLSSIHSTAHPFSTSRDTTAAGFLSEAGLSPLDVERIVLVIRSYPIRVAGNSGPLPKEISWDTLGKPPEYSTVTKRIRRVAEFDSELVKKAIAANNPTCIVLNFMDYIEIENQKTFICDIEKRIERPINYIGVNATTLEKRI